MTAFFDVLDTAYAESRGQDRAIPIAITLELIFKTTTMRLWSGYGEMTTPDGNTWLGWHNGDTENPQSYIRLPAVTALREGNAPDLPFELGYLDKESYDRIRADEAEVENGRIHMGRVVMPATGMNARSNPGAISRLRMKAASFAERYTKRDDGSFDARFIASITARNANAGRGGVDFGTMTETGQRLRAERFYGFTNDRYAEFIPLYGRGITLTV